MYGTEPYGATEIEFTNLSIVESGGENDSGDAEFKRMVTSLRYFGNFAKSFWSRATPPDGTGELGLLSAASKGELMGRVSDM